MGAGVLVVEAAFEACEAAQGSAGSDWFGGWGVKGFGVCEVFESLDAALPPFADGHVFDELEFRVCFGLKGGDQAGRELFEEVG